MKGNAKMNVRKNGGFTIIELLVVIAIMAVVATLATQAAMKSIRQARTKRIKATISSLELALVNYRTLHGKWSFDIGDMEEDEKLGARFMWLHGKNNAKAFKDLLVANQSRKSYLDASALLTRVNGARMTVQKALGNNKGEIAIGYVHPDNTDKFYYYCIMYRRETDSIQVQRSDLKHTSDRQENEQFECPEKD